MSRTRPWSSRALRRTAPERAVVDALCGRQLVVRVFSADGGRFEVGFWATPGVDLVAPTPPGEQPDEYEVVFYRNPPRGGSQRQEFVPVLQRRSAFKKRRTYGLAGLAPGGSFEVACRCTQRAHTLGCDLLLAQAGRGRPGHPRVVKVAALELRQ